MVLNIESKVANVLFNFFYLTRLILVYCAVLMSPIRTKLLGKEGCIPVPKFYCERKSKISIHIIDTGDSFGVKGETRKWRLIREKYDWHRRIWVIILFIPGMQHLSRDIVSYTTPDATDCLEQEVFAMRISMRAESGWRSWISIFFMCKTLNLNFIRPTLIASLSLAFQMRWLNLVIIFFMHFQKNYNNKPKPSVVVLRSELNWFSYV